MCVYCYSTQQERRVEDASHALKKEHKGVGGEANTKKSHRFLSSCHQAVFSSINSSTRDCFGALPPLQVSSTCTILGNYWRGQVGTFLFASNWDRWMTGGGSLVRKLVCLFQFKTIPFDWREDSCCWLVCRSKAPWHLISLWLGKDAAQNGKAGGRGFVKCTFNNWMPIHLIWWLIFSTRSLLSIRQSGGYIRLKIKGNPPPPPIVTSHRILSCLFRFISHLLSSATCRFTSPHTLGNFLPLS